MKMGKNKEKKEKQPKSKLREWLEFALVVALAAAFALFIRFNVGQLFFVSGESMQPTFQHGDFAIASLLSYRNEEPQRGDVFVFEAKELGDKKLIKRVVGLPGDEIEIIEGVLHRNGKAVKEDYIQQEANESFGPVTVPNGHVFAMGDNRDFSTDSRFIGPVSMEDIVGKVVLELWNNPFKKH